jgi:hypothetical protein
MIMEDKYEEVEETLDPLLKALENEAVPGLTLKSGDLDREIISVLNIATSWYTQRVLGDFENGFELEERLWRILGAVLMKYRDQVAKYQKRGDKIHMRDSFDRLDKVLKFGKRFYREFIKRLVELQGAPEDLKPLLVLLKLEDVETQLPLDSAVSRIYESVSYSLCRLGDLSRYGSTLNYNHEKRDHSHARVYYRSSLNMNPSSGLPCNQLGNLAVATGDYFYAFYWFLKAQSVEKPFSVNNVRKIAMKIFQMDMNDLVKCPLGDFDDTTLTLDVKRAILKLLYSFVGLHIYDLIYRQNQGPVKQRNLNSVVSTFKTVLSEQYANISSSLLVDLSLLGPMLIQQTSQAENENADQDEVFCLTTEILRSMLEIGLLSFEGYRQSSEETVPTRLKPILPAMRVYFDWLAKLIMHSNTSYWETYTSVFTILFRFVELVRQEYGFQFDSLTAVKTLSGQRALLALEEEKKTRGMTPWDGALNDTPSGMNAKEAIKQDTPKFQCQCLLFTAIELARLEQTPLRFDEINQQFIFLDERSTDLSDENASETTITSYNDATMATTYIKDSLSDDDDDEVVFKGRKR